MLDIDDAIIIKDYKYSPCKRKSLEKVALKEIFSNIDKTSFESKLFCMAKYIERFKSISLENDKTNDILPFWNNGWIPPLDAMSIYTFLAENNPRYYIECGSGNTTKFAYKSIIDNGLQTKIISIDPQPRAEIDKICEKIYRIPFENMDLDFVSMLSRDDIFIIDNSHRSFANSDVTVFFTEVLPNIPDGVLFALHDIFLPYDYPNEWNEGKRFYNEQYLLFSYLLGGAMGDEIYFPCSFIGNDTDLKEIIGNLFNRYQNSQMPIVAGGGFFWLKKNNK